MAIGTPLAAGNATGTGTASSLAATIPAGASIGDLAYFVTCESTGTATCTTPTGWTLVQGPVDDGASTQRAYLFSKTLASGDPGATVTASWSAAGRVACAVATVPGASGQDAIVQWTDATADLTLTIPAITPVANDCLELALVMDRYAAAATTGVTPAAGWTELVDNSTANTTNPKLGAWVAYKQLTGQAGVAQPTYDNTYASVARNVAWVVTVAPVAATNVNGDATSSSTATTTTAGAVGKVTGSTSALTAALTAAATIGAVAAATLTGTAAVTAAGVVGTSTGSSITAAASTTTAGSIGAAGLSTGATLTGTAATTPAGQTGTTSGTSLTGTAACTAAGIVGATTSATLNATAATSTAGFVGRSVGASLTGTVAVTAAGSVGAAGGSSAAVSGSVTITAVATYGATSPTSIPATATLTAAGTVGRAAASTITGSASTNAAGSIATQTTATLAATASIDTSGVVYVAGAVTPGSMTGGDAPRAHARGDASPATNATGTDKTSGGMNGQQSATARMNPA